MSSKLYIAAAGSGKTRKIIEDSLDTDKKVLILTYTIKNKEQIVSRFKNKVGIIPKNITISTWFAFLLKDGIRPYQGNKFKERIEGIIFKNGQGDRYLSKDSNEYFAKENKIYTNKLSECVVALNNDCDGKVIERITKIYDKIYVDEVQDMVGYDLEFLKYLMSSRTDIIMVGDPRQCTYSTHSSKKYKKYSCGKIDEFIINECKELDIMIDDITLSCTYRNNDIICKFANSLYPDKAPAGFVNKAIEETDGVKIIDKSNIDKYLNRFHATQLRDNKKISVNTKYKYYNFGEAKGLEFKHVLIYPTKPMWNWIIDKSKKLKDQSKAKLYVAITRAMDSVVIVCIDESPCELPIIKL